MSRASRLGKNTVLVFIGKLGSSIIGFLMLPFYTKWLGVEAFGEADIITVYSSFLLILVTCCISESIFIFPKNKDKQTQTAYFSSALTFIIGMFVLTALVFGLVQIIADYLSLHNTFVNNIWLIFFLVVSTSLQQFIQQFTRSIDKIIVFSITGLINTAAIAVFAILFMPKWGVEGYVMSLVSASLVSALYSLIASKSYCYINCREVAQNLTKSMLIYSIPLMPNGIMWWLVGSLNRPLMERYLDLHEIGLYAVANRFPGIITLVFGVFATSWQISVLEEFGKDGFKNFYNSVFKIIYSLTLLLLIVIVLGSKLIVTVFTDDVFYDAWHYIPLLTLGSLFSNISGFCGSIFSATRESKYFFYSSVWAAVVSVVLNFILIRIWGTYGVCIAFILSFVAMSLCRIYYSWKYVKLDSYFQYVLWLLILIGIIVLYVNDVSYYITLGCSFLLLFLIIKSNKGNLNVLISSIKLKIK